MPEDALKVRGRITPDKWPIEAPPIGLPVSSTLHADVPEFVPGKAYNFTPVYNGKFKVIMEGLYTISIKRVCIRQNLLLSSSI